MSLVTNHLYSNNCNQNPSDPDCFCYGHGPSEKHKIFDIRSSKYVCCGVISPFLDQDNALISAAEKDNPMCLGWWNGTANNLSTISPLPAPGTDFYLPDDTELQGNMPISYGPSNEDLSVLTNQAQIFALFTQPTNTIVGGNPTLGGNSVTVSCPNGSYVAWLHYPNPNAGMPFSSTMVCSAQDVNSLKQQAIYQNGDWALFSPKCSSVTANTCSTSAGEIMGSVNPSTVGNLIIATPKYTGGTPTPVPSDGSSDGIVIFLVVFFGLVIIIILSVLVYLYYFKPSNIPVSSSIDII